MGFNYRVFCIIWFIAIVLPLILAWITNRW